MGLALIAGVRVRTAAVLSALVLAVYLAAIASACARGLSIDGGCFGNGGQVAAGQTAYPAEIARDVGLLVVALALARSVIIGGTELTDLSSSGVTAAVKAAAG